MAKSKPIGLGIVGLGRAGRGMHCKELQTRGEMFQIVAGCDTAADRRERFAREQGCCVYGNIKDLIADPNVEMVDIATRSSDHYQHAMMALKAGKGVFLEKPMCLTYAEARWLQAAAKKSKGRLYIRHNRRFEGAFNQVRDIISSGVLGEVYQIKLARVSYNRRNDWQTLISFGGGQLLNWGPHIIDHALRLLGSPVEGIWSDLKRVAAVGDAEDHFKIVLVGKNRRMVDVEISGGATTKLPQYVVWGTKGGLTCDGKTIELKYLDPSAKLPPCKASPGNPGEGFGNPEKLKWVEKTVPVEPMDMSQIWDHLYNAVRKGRRFPITLDEAVQVMWVVSQAKKGTKFQLRRR